MTLQHTRFTITAQSDRMGYRLEGPVLELRRALEPVSEAVAFGTVRPLTSRLPRASTTMLLLRLVTSSGRGPEPL